MPRVGIELEPLRLLFGAPTDYAAAMNNVSLLHKNLQKKALKIMCITFLLKSCGFKKMGCSEIYSSFKTFRQDRL